MRTATHARSLAGPLASLLIVIASLAGNLIFDKSAALAAFPGPFPQCPRVGWDLSCELLIQINANGTVTVLKDPGEGSYDGVEDTLIGVQNNSSFGIKTIDLTGVGAPLTGPFNFDGDGICNLPTNVGPNLSTDNTSNTFTPGNCNFGPTKYEGPGTMFTNYSPATGCGSCIGNTGTVIFTSPQGLPAGRGAYFSLEGKVTAQVGVVIDPSITARGITFSATEGQPYSGPVATFTDPDPASQPTEYSATIDWGDSTPTTVGTISGSGGNFTVNGTHTYVEEGPPPSGTYSVTVTITDIDNHPNSDTAHSTAKVGDAPLIARCPTPATTTTPASTLPPISPQSFAGVTAAFTDTGTGTLSDFSATITWGDTTSSTGTVAGSGGAYTVSGTHAYASTGTFTVTTKINDVGGASATVDCQLIVFAFANEQGAAFVIGDLEAGLGNHVTWWSSQWANINLMSKGAPPDAMKGFAGFEDALLGMLPPPDCTNTWQTDPGNSTPPPASVPQVMGVIVSSQVTQSGSVISGDVKQVIIVDNDPGYQPSPGHPGTGKEIAILCVAP